VTTKLYFLRHGITEWNLSGRYCGHKDVNLSRKGRAQAAKLKKGLRDINFYSIYCSDRRRALQTRKIIFGNKKFTILKDLQEIHFGLIEGLNHNQIMERYPKAYKEWLSDPYKGRIPEAEPLPLFKKRVFGVIRKILKNNYGKSVAVVCHGGVIAIFVSTILKSRKFWNYVPSAGSLTIAEFKNNEFKIKVFNKK
jgi:broad specificity phosphatase PhoE